MVAYKCPRFVIVDDNEEEAKQLKSSIISVFGKLPYSGESRVLLYKELIEIYGLAHIDYVLIDVSAVCLPGEDVRYGHERIGRWMAEPQASKVFIVTRLPETFLQELFEDVERIAGKRPFYLGDRTEKVVRDVIGPMELKRLQHMTKEFQPNYVK